MCSTEVHYDQASSESVFWAYCPNCPSLVQKSIRFWILSKFIQDFFFFCKKRQYTLILHFFYCLNESIKIFKRLLLDFHSSNERIHVTRIRLLDSLRSRPHGYVRLIDEYQKVTFKILRRPANRGNNLFSRLQTKLIVELF